jgi:hypothetical protein
MKFHFELVCASPYSDISEQDRKPICSEHCKKNLKHTFFVPFRKVEAMKQTIPSLARYPCGGLYPNP